MPGATSPRVSLAQSNPSSWGHSTDTSNYPRTACCPLRQPACGLLPGRRWRIIGSHSADLAGLTPTGGGSLGRLCPPAPVRSFQLRGRNSRGECGFAELLTQRQQAGRGISGAPGAGGSAWVLSFPEPPRAVAGVPARNSADQLPTLALCLSTGSSKTLI